MSGLIQEILNSELDFPRKVELLDLNLEFSSLSQENEEAVVSSVNFSLNAVKTRPYGFWLIIKSINNFSEATLTEYASTWLNTCLHFVKTNRDAPSSAYFCMIDILTRCDQVPSARKKVAMNNVPHLVDHICMNTTKATYHLCELLFVCVEIYSSSCGPRRDLIKSFVLTNILFADRPSRETLAKIFAQLYSISIQGKSPPINQSWREFMSILISTVDSLLDLLRTQELTFMDMNLTSQPVAPLFSFDKSSVDTIDSTSCLNAFLNTEIQFEFVYNAIIKMMANVKLDCLEIPVQALLIEVAKVCSVSLQDIYNKSSILGCIVLSVHIHTLSVLENLIKLCGTSLSIHSKFMMNLFTRLLEKSSIPDTLDRPPQHRNLNSLKLRCYELIELWFNLVGPNVQLSKKTLDIFLKHMMEDIAPSEALVQLRDAKSRKLEAKGEKISCKGEDMAFSNLVHQSLKALKSLVSCNILLMPGTSKQSLINFILEEGLSYFRTPVNHHRVEYRLEFRHDLLSLILLMCHKCPEFPGASAVIIFSEALKVETDPQLKSYYLESLSTLNSMINPIKHIKISEDSTNEVFNALILQIYGRTRIKIIPND